MRRLFVLASTFGLAVALTFASSVRTGDAAVFTSGHATIARQVDGVTISDVIGYAALEQTGVGKIRVAFTLSQLSPGAHTFKIRKLAPAGACIGTGPALRSVTVTAGSRGVAHGSKSINGSVNNLLLYKGVGTVIEVKDGTTIYCGVLLAD